MTVWPSFDLSGHHDPDPSREGRFRAKLDESLHPRGPDLLYDIIDRMGLPTGASTLDVGCGEGFYALALAQRCGLAVHGLDPAPRHIEATNDSLAAAAVDRPVLRQRVRFTVGVAEHLPAGDASIDLMWCRDGLTKIAELDRAYAEIRRVLRPGGRAMICQTFATERLEDGEARWLFDAMGIPAANADSERTYGAITAAGLRVDQTVEVDSEWGEYGEESSGAGGRRLLHAARLLRDPESYVRWYGPSAYHTMLGDCMWHIYQMIGKLSPYIYVLSR